MYIILHVYHFIPILGEIMEEDIAKIGDTISDPPQTVFKLILEDYVKLVKPKDYDVDERTINPIDYFITSGDAVQKAIILKRDLEILSSELHNKCLKIISEENNCSMVEAETLYENVELKSSRLKEYEKEISNLVKSSGVMLSDLIKAKGKNIFLETEWDSHNLLCIPKNPRKIT